MVGKNSSYLPVTVGSSGSAPTGGISCCSCLTCCTCIHLSFLKANCHHHCRCCVIITIVTVIIVFVIIIDTTSSCKCDFSRPLVWSRLVRPCWLSSHRCSSSNMASSEHYEYRDDGDDKTQPLINEICWNRVQLTQPLINQLGLRRRQLPLAKQEMFWTNWRLLLMTYMFWPGFPHSFFPLLSTNDL